jgi:hypothetical protein
MTCHGNCSRNGSKRGIFLRDSLSVNSTSSTPCDKSVARCPSTRPVWSCFGMLRTNLPRNLRSRSLSLALLLEFSFYFGYQDYWTEESVLDCGEPHYQHYYPKERVGASGSAGPTTVGVLGKAHRIHATVNNR